MRSTFPSALLLTPLLAGVELAGTAAQPPGPQICSEVSMTRRLSDGSEHTHSIPRLIAIGGELLDAIWTSEEGGGRPLTKGTAGALADLDSPLVFPRNFNRWYEPGTGRNTRTDPIGLPEDGHSLYGYAQLGNPPLNSDFRGLFSLAPGQKCKRLTRPSFRRKLEQLKTKPECVRFFREELDADLAKLIDGPLPVVLITPRVPGAKTHCTGDPGAIWINPRLCSFGYVTAKDFQHAVLHELGHFADCDRNRFPPGGPTEEGAEAERACFGFSIDRK
jgi:hypothetical protein